MTEEISIENVPVVVASETPQIDEDYEWLTERLDGHAKTMMEMRESLTKIADNFQTSLRAMEETNRTASNESRTMIENLTAIVQTLSGSLTNLASSVELKLTPQSSIISSSPIEEIPPITETIVSPENGVEGNPEVRTSPEVKKRRRL